MSKSTGPFTFNFETAGTYSQENWLDAKKNEKFKGLVITETYESNGLTDVVTHVHGTAPTKAMIKSLEAILGTK